jgi:hypothetical protein
MFAEWWSGNLIRRNHVEELGVSGRIISKWAFMKFGVTCEIVQAQDSSQ